MMFKSKVLRRIFVLRQRTQQKCTENCIMTSFIICTLHIILLGWSNQEGWHGQTSSAHGWSEKCTHSFGLETL